MSIIYYKSRHFYANYHKINVILVASLNINTESEPWINNVVNFDLNRYDMVCENRERQLGQGAAPYANKKPVDEITDKMSIVVVDLRVWNI